MKKNWKSVVCYSKHLNYEQYGLTIFLKNGMNNKSVAIILFWVYTISLVMNIDERIIIPTIIERLYDFLCWFRVYPFHKGRIKKKN